ncbi:MAG: sulfatase-like hydrolase/transferase, partial [Muribaculaceae bacterium]|nr:sulfatase-like hydrolase/transferase [Muribaculaceae bacterium]
YTDRCLGEFMHRFEKSEKWKNALVIIVPDHYGAYPRNLTEPVERHRIPLVITGGAVASSAPMTLDMPASQSDIAATLLTQLGLSASDFPLSHNFLTATFTHYAFFSEPDFAGVVTESDSTVISTRDSNILRGSGKPAYVNLTKAFLQNIYDDLSKR